MYNFNIDALVGFIVWFIGECTDRNNDKFIIIIYRI